MNAAQFSELCEFQLDRDFTDLQIQKDRRSKCLCFKKKKERKNLVIKMKANRVITLNVKKSTLSNDLTGFII